MIYRCPRCGYKTELKSNIRRHLNLKELCNLKNLDVNPKDYKDIILREDNTDDRVREKMENLKIQNLNKNENYDPGYIYVMHNEQFGKNVYKIGCSKNPNVRIKDFRTSYVNPPVLKYLSNKVDNKLETEKIVFEKLKDYRIKDNREFFNLELKEIINTIENLII
jgi:hypothetical protein